MADRPALTGASMANAYRYDAVLPRSTILVFNESLVPRRRSIAGRHPFRRLAATKDGVGVACAGGPGAPSAAVAVEFLAAFGVQRLVVVGSGGDLAGGLDAGPHCVVKAISDEGTSVHYGADLTADGELSDRLLELTGGPSRTAVTTDVPFRHTADRLDRFRAAADVIEMECAAIFAAAAAFSIAAGALVVISDHFDEANWQLHDPDEVGIVLASAVDLAAAVLAS